jgi:hypothetical protein
MVDTVKTVVLGGDASAIADFAAAIETRLDEIKSSEERFKKMTVLMRGLASNIREIISEEASVMLLASMKYNKDNSAGTDDRRWGYIIGGPDAIKLQTLESRRTALGADDSILFGLLDGAVRSKKRSRRISALEGYIRRLREYKSDNGPLPEPSLDVKDALKAADYDLGELRDASSRLGAVQDALQQQHTYIDSKALLLAELVVEAQAGGSHNSAGQAQRGLEFRLHGGKHTLLGMMSDLGLTPSHTTVLEMEAEVLKKWEAGLMERIEKEVQKMKATLPPGEKVIVEIIFDNLNKLV